jgi:putative endonuclease
MDGSSQNFYTYILLCGDKTFYTGWTTNIESRLKAHNEGRGSRYTRARLPVEVLTYWQFQSKAEAMSFEWKVKQLKREEKLALVEQRQGKI